MRLADSRVRAAGAGQRGRGAGQYAADRSPYLWSAERPKSAIGEINVFRRFSSERTAAMREFYGEVLGVAGVAGDRRSAAGR